MFNLLKLAFLIMPVIAQISEMRSKRERQRSLPTHIESKK